MDIREKLIELIAKAKYIYANDYSDHTEDEYIADTLLDNGVTAQEWVSVEDKLPEFCVSVLARCFYNGKWRTLVCHTSKEHTGEWYTDEVYQWVKVTHWMPLPELPKGESLCQRM